MAMRINWFGPTCLRAHCRIHDIRAVLDNKGAWHLAEMDQAMIDADPHTPVTLEWELAWMGQPHISRRIVILHGDEDTVVGYFPAFLLAALSQYNYHVGPETDPLYVV